MRIIIIGGCGFIGSHLGNALIEGGHEVIAIDSLMVNNIYSGDPFGDLHKNILQKRMQGSKAEVIIADARDYNMLSPICKSRKPDAIIHLAAVAHQGKAQKTPHTTFDHSLRTLENALDIAVNLNVGRFVYFSSSTVYGDWPQSGVVDEKSPCTPKGLYGTLKYMGEILVREYMSAYRLPCTIIRPSALYGSGCVSGRVIQKFIETAMLGGDLTASDECLDFTHIDDLVAGVSLALESPNAADQTYNVTYGEGYDIYEAGLYVQKCFPDIKVNRSSLVDQQFAKRGRLSVSKAKADFNYAPSVPLEKGIHKYVQWYLNEHGSSIGN